MAVMAVDPGTIKMGYAVLDCQEQILAHGTIQAPARHPVEMRLAHMLTETDRLLDQWQPKALAIETPYLAPGGGRHINAAIAIGQAQAVVIAAAARREIPVTRHTPAEVKKAVTGYGNATKEDVQNAVQAQTGMERRPAPDEADAVAIGLCHSMKARANAALARTQRDPPSNHEMETIE